MRKIFAAAGVLSVILTASLAHATDPAVSGLNGKISGEGGLFDDESSGFASGSFAVPLGHAFGMQVDGTLGAIDNQLVGGGGVHLFTRDPSSYLLGVYGSYHTWDSIDVWRLAGEGELYIDRFTVTGLAGYEKYEVPSFSGGLPVLTEDSGHFFGMADLAYYINDDFKIYAGYRYYDEASFAGAGAEYLIRGHYVPLSLFARGDFGNDDYTRITGGVKIYLSPEPEKSLIDRHRRDDPDIFMPVFPRLATGTNQCGVGPGPEYRVTGSPDCLCPSGTFRAGQAPEFISYQGGMYVCGRLT